MWTAALLMAAVGLLAPGSVLTSSCPKNYSSTAGGCYLFNNEDQLDWYEARQFCIDNDGILAIITECEVFTKIVRHIHSFGLEVPKRFSYWLGGSDEGDEGSWYWIDQTPMAMGIPFWGSVANWTEPGGGKDQNCAQMYHDDRYYFHDGECDRAGYALCMTESI